MVEVAASPGGGKGRNSWFRWCRSSSGGRPPPPRRSSAAPPASTKKSAAFFVAAAAAAWYGYALLNLMVWSSSPPLSVGDNGNSNAGGHLSVPAAAAAGSFSAADRRRIRQGGGGGDDGDRFHVVFSTGCTPYQDWQSYAFFYHAAKSGQKGEVTRVASGCGGPEAEAAVRATFETEIVNGGFLGSDDAGLAESRRRFHLHLTPDFSSTVMNGTNYKFFNKPWGLKHWFDHGLKYESNREELDDTIFIVLDPDQWIVRPFVRDYADEVEAYHEPGAVIHRSVSHGHPMSQLYGMGASWSDKINVTEILNGDREAARASPLNNWTWADINAHYVAGPPYIATGRDMYRIVTTWRDVSVPVYRQTTDFLSEMFAYSVAAGHLGLPHQLLWSFMASNADVDQEAWPIVPGAAAPRHQHLVEQHLRGAAGASDANAVPHVLHFCQRFHLGPYFFAKYSVPLNILSCRHPLLKVPNATGKSNNMSACIDEIGSYDYSIIPAEGGRMNVAPPTIKSVKAPYMRKRHAFMLCYLLNGMNSAATHYKERHCSGDPTTSYEKTYVWPHTQLKL